MRLYAYMPLARDTHLTLPLFLSDTHRQIFRQPQQRSSVWDAGSQLDSELYQETISYNQKVSQFVGCCSHNTWFTHWTFKFMNRVVVGLLITSSHHPTLPFPFPADKRLMPIQHMSTGNTGQVCWARLPANHRTCLLAMISGQWMPEVPVWPCNYIMIELVCLCVGGGWCSPAMQ